MYTQIHTRLITYCKMCFYKCWDCSFYLQLMLECNDKMKHMKMSVSLLASLHIFIGLFVNFFSQHTFSRLELPAGKFITSIIYFSAS